MKMQKSQGGGAEGSGQEEGGQGGCVQRFKVFVKMKKKVGWGGRGPIRGLELVGGGGGGRGGSKVWGSG